MRKFHVRVIHQKENVGAAMSAVVGSVCEFARLFGAILVLASV
jgi:hypothetical protein